MGIAEFTLTERTEPFTLDEVFVFIDNTYISKIDAHELKSRIVDVVQDTRNKAVDEFYDNILNFEDYIEPIEDGGVLLYSGVDITNMIVKIRNGLKAEQTKG